MIVDEQHDLDKAKESVYIFQRGVLKVPYLCRNFFTFPSLYWDFRIVSSFIFFFLLLGNGNSLYHFSHFHSDL